MPRFHAFHASHDIADVSPIEMADCHIYDDVSMPPRRVDAA